MPEDQLILNPPTEADIKKMYADWRKDPNLLSFWFPKVRDCGFRVPETTIIPVPDDILHSLFLEEEGDLARVEGFIRDTIMPRIKDMEARTGGRIPFLKNGCFSGKFDFQTCAPKDDRPETILKSFLTINQDAIAFGSMGATEFVIRERIPAPKDAGVIYHGMPLRTEYRIFYDFDLRRVLYAANYWDASNCADHMQGRDQQTFMRQTPFIAGQYVKDVPAVMKECEEKLADVQGLGGVWSVDLLKDADGRLWLIDMAVGRRSAYWDPVKALMLSFEKEYWATLRSLEPHPTGEETEKLLLAAPLQEISISAETVNDLWDSRRFPFLLEKASLTKEDLLARYTQEDALDIVEKYNHLREKYPDDKKVKHLERILQMYAAREYCRERLFTYEGLQSYLKKHDIFPDDIHTSPALAVASGREEVEVSLEWGDWKHGHAWLDYLMKNIGFERGDETVTEEDGSDCYSSVHTFSFKG